MRAGSGELRRASGPVVAPLESRSEPGLQEHAETGSIAVTLRAWRRRGDTPDRAKRGVRSR
jgi:hypothetical protein